MWKIKSEVTVGIQFCWIFAAVIVISVLLTAAGADEKVDGFGVGGSVSEAVDINWIAQRNGILLVTE